MSIATAFLASLIWAPLQDVPGASIVASPEHRLEPGTSVLWCSSVQMGWNALEELVGGSIQLQGGNPPEALAHLNRSTLTAEHVDPRALVVRAGRLTAELVEDIQLEIRTQLGRERDPALDVLARSLGDSGGTLTYAFLRKDLPFEHRFEAFDDEPIPFRASSDDAGTPILNFGFQEYEPTERKKAQAEQVRILHYAGPADFTVRLTPKGGRDEILLCRIPPGATLRSTMDAAFARIAAGNEEQLQYKDVLLLPKLDLELRRDYDELVGRTLANPGFQGQPILAFSQDIALRFDERGAAFESRFMGAFGGCKPPDHDMRFDGPFLMMLRETGRAEPYLALWAGNAELLSQPPEPLGGELVSIEAPDGFRLAARLFRAKSAAAGPAVLFLHQGDRRGAQTGLEPIANRLAERGVHALVLDFRGYGGSVDEQFTSAEASHSSASFEEDVEASLAFLLAQSGVDGERIGVVGASIGGRHATIVAGRHAEVRALCLISANLGRSVATTMSGLAERAVLCIAAERDPYARAAEAAREAFILSSHAASQLLLYKGQAHGVPLLEHDPELPQAIAVWMVERLQPR